MLEYGWGNKEANTKWRRDPDKANCLPEKQKANHCHSNPTGMRRTSLNTSTHGQGWNRHSTADDTNTHKKNDNKYSTEEHESSCLTKGGKKKTNKKKQ